MAEANLFRIKRITGVADTEASNGPGPEPSKRGRERQEEGAAGGERVDRELIVFWQGSGQPAMV